MAQPSPELPRRPRPAPDAGPGAGNPVQLACAAYRRGQGAGCLYRCRRPVPGSAVPRCRRRRGRGQQPGSHRQPEEQPGNPPLPARAGGAERCPALSAGRGEAAVRRGLPRPAVPSGFAAENLRVAGKRRLAG
ncbi:protein piccolo-like protein [Corchorus olitorius]|uniref:Protein piccolo-like protein n=1 Tax=Corchorus olitorius TaxID=93759 RepID=A0A1R3L0S3_9ROSI|nr:protein piccolo-like protein [Corchorus olitorius]